MLFFFPLFSLSWWAHAHMMIAQIAQDSLSSNEIKKLTQIINENGLPRQSLVECSRWQDDLKDIYNLKVMGNWHFSDKPLLRNKTKIIDLPEITYDIITYLKEVWTTLNDPTTTSLWAWSFHLRSISHFVGDIHTPHHNVALYDDTFTSGDNGGNSYKLNCPFGAMCNNIHFFWDAAASNYIQDRPVKPLTNSDFMQNVSKLMDNYPPNKVNAEEFSFDPEGWSQESYQYADLYGYDTPLYSFPNETYFDLTKVHCDERVAAAGYRLGEVYSALLKNAPTLSDNYYIMDIVVWVLDALLAVFIFVALWLLRKPANISYEHLVQSSGYI